MEQKQIDGYTNYVITSTGQVIETNHNRVLKPLVNPKTGYCTVGLSKQCIRTGYYIHHLVARYFMEPKPSSAHEIDHIDSDKNNNSVENLQWVTKRENSLKTIRKNKTSKYHCISTTTNKGKIYWVAQLSVIERKGKKHIGSYKTEREALEALNKVCIELGLPTQEFID